MAEMAEDNRELQDLSHNDAEELQAFVAKRKWFEIKLKELESHAPIYPFVKVDLETSGQNSNTETAQTDNEFFGFTLPELTQVKKWQEERDAVEEEVVTFDGGDLERMKQKTRAVTLLPLTPPSTELVEVTLDLIVVVDRLLTLLRRRSELLELTKLRLHWDELRRACAEELDEMKLEADLIVARKCEWLPKGTTSRNGSDIPQSCPTPPSFRSKDPDAVPTTPRQRILSLPDTPSPSRRSPGSNSHATPRRASLRIPLMRSQITNLRIRHTTLSTTVLPRVGALLDKIIDVAGPLQGLGSVSGPMEEGAEGDGAVPGELLDAQDDLESQAANIGKHVQWVQRLEAQCTSAEQSYSSLVQIRQTASSIVARLVTITEVDLDLLPTLWAEWEVVSASLPPVIDRTAYSSSETRDYPRNNEHEAQVLSLLEEAREAAQIELEKGRKGLDWLERLSQQLLVVNRCCSELASRKHEVVRLLDRIPNHHTTSQPLQSIDHELAADLEEWYTRTSAAGQERPDLYQQSTIAGMQYRAILQNPAPSLADVMIAQDDGAPTRLDDIREMSSSKLAELLEVRTRFLRDQQIGSLAAELREASVSLRIHLAATSSKLVQRIEMAGWNGPHQNKPISMEDIDVELSKSRDQISADLATRLRNLEVLVGGDPRYAETLSNSTKHFNAVQLIYQTTSNHQELLSKVMTQTKAVDTIHDEANALLANIQRSNLEPIALASLQDEVTTWLDAIEVTTWLDAIAKRIPFLAPDLPTTSTDHASTSVRESTSHSPEASLSLPKSDMFSHLASSDQLVRVALNSLTARVSSALEQALHSTSGKSESVDRAVDDHDQQSLENHSDSASSSSKGSSTSIDKLDSMFTTGEQQTSGSYRKGSPSKASNGDHMLHLSSERTTEVKARPALKLASTAEPNTSRHPKPVDTLGMAVTPRPRDLSFSGVRRRSSRKSLTSAQQVSSFPKFFETPGSAQSSNLPRSCYTSHSGFPGSASRSTSRLSSSLSPPVATPISGQSKSASLGRAAGDLYSSRRAPSISNVPDRYPVAQQNDRLGSSSSQREDRILARSTSMRSISLGRSSSNTPSSSRFFSASLASGSGQSRTPSSRYPTPHVKKSARKYVPDPANKLDVAVGDIVNGFKVHVPIVPIGMTAKDEYKDMTGSYWIGAEGRAKLCFCRILRSQMVMVRVGGGWMELSKFLIDHFGGPAIEQSLSSLSLQEQSEDPPADLVTPIRPRTVSTASAVTRTPEQADGSPRKEGETNGSPLTPLRFIKRASDSPDVRQKEKATLRIGRRSILGKE